MSSPVRWGLLSTAAINDLVLQACAGSTMVEFVAVASRDERTAQRYAHARGIPIAYGSYEQMLEDPDIDAVYVSLPNSMHLAWSVRALGAGKHVLCEKPLGRDSAAVARAFDLAERSDRLLREAFMYRFHPQTSQIAGLVASGCIGEIKHVHATLSYPMPCADTDVRGSLALDGGALLDVGCYCASGFRLLAGEPERVAGHAVPGSSGVDVRFLGTLFSATGVTGQFDCGMTLPRRDRLEIVGEEGVILVPDPWHCRGAPLEIQRAQRRTRVPVQEGDAYRAEFEAISGAIIEHTDLAFGRDDAVAQAAVLAALWESAERDVPVEISTMALATGVARPHGSEK